MALAAPGKDDARRSSLLEGDALGMRPGFEAKVRAPERGLQEAARRAPAAAALLVHLEIRRAFVIAGVEILDLADARGFAGIANRVEYFPAHARIFDAPLPAAAMGLIRRRDMVLMGEEDRQHIAPAPAGKAELAPAVIIGGLAAHIDHGVDRG